MNVNDTYASGGNSLKAADLNDQEYTLTIDHVEEVEFKDDTGAKTKGVVHFSGYEKTLVLNKTNAMRIADAYGAETDGWTGKDIIVFPDVTNFGGSTVPCIRVRIPARPAAPGSLPGGSASEGAATESTF